MATANFPSEIPNPTPKPFEETYEPRILSMNFGDGYMQRASDGLNPILRRWNLTWTVLPEDQAKILMNFLQERGGIEPFYWNAPFSKAAGEDTERVKVICRNWRRIHEDEVGSFLQIRVVFEEVIE